MKVIHYGNTTFDKDKFQVITNDNWQKPKGGLWTSPVNSEFGWKDWNEAEEFKECDIDNSFKLKLKDKCKIIKIDSKEDLSNIQDICKNEFGKYLNFEAIAKKYDAIWLTEKGESETRHCGMWDDEFPKMYGWDCETVLILNSYCIEEVE